VAEVRAAKSGEGTGEEAGVSDERSGGGGDVEREDAGEHPDGAVAPDALGVRQAVLDDEGARVAEAVRGAELLVMPDPAFTQEGNAARLAPHLADGQVVFLPPGTFGSYVMSRIIRNAGNRADFAFAETGTLPWLTRKHGPATAAITARATRLPTGVYPNRNRELGFSVLRKAFSSIEPVEDALSAALMNAGPVIHPPLILMNAGPLEHFERWDIHKEGTQPSIRRVTDALDAERVAVREALGYKAPHFPLADHYRTDGDEWMYGRRVHKKLTDSKDWHEHIVLTEHRYMREDVELGLAFLVSVCEWAGVPCPVARGLLALGSAVIGRDLRAMGRTLENLGLSRLSKSGMQQLL
jgi:opine dehydrogenase